MLCAVGNAPAGSPAATGSSAGSGVSVAGSAGAGAFCVVPEAYHKPPPRMNNAAIETFHFICEAYQNLTVLLYLAVIGQTARVNTNMNTMAGKIVGIAAALAVLGAFYFAFLEKKPADTGNAPDKSDLIRLTSPLPNTVISSPLAITGVARGNWFFEASFPVFLTDWDGRIIAQTIATAEGDWMTADFVPFTATLAFDPADAGAHSDRATLILKKENASGLPEHDDALEIPLRLAPPEAMRTYSSTEYGISFPYPSTYLLTEHDAAGSALRKHHVITLLRREDLPLPENGEGPPSITIDIYQNDLDRQTAEQWIRNSGASNFKLGNGLLTRTTAGGLPALSYRWSGLYEGTTVVVAEPAWIYAMSVTYMEMGAPIVQDFAALRDSARITKSAN